jgi:hypothetical protein
VRAGAYPGAVTAAISPRRVTHRAEAVAPTILGVAFWVVLPVLCVITLGVGVDHLARHVNNVPSGTRGSYLVTSRSCDQQLCITAGTFSSTDGRIVEPNLLGDYRWQLGQKYGVVYNVNAAEVIRLPAHWDPSATVIGMAGAAGFLGLWVWCLRAVRRARRTPPGSAAEAVAR